MSTDSSKDYQYYQPPINDPFLISGKNMSKHNSTMMMLNRTKTSPSPARAGETSGIELKERETPYLENRQAIKIVGGGDNSEQCDDTPPGPFKMEDKNIVGHLSSGENSR